MLLLTLLLSHQSLGKDAYLFPLPSDGCHCPAVIGWKSDDSTFLTEIIVSQPAVALVTGCHRGCGQWCLGHVITRIRHREKIKGLQVLREAQTGQHKDGWWELQTCERGHASGNKELRLIRRWV